MPQIESKVNDAVVHDSASTAVQSSRYYFRCHCPSAAAHYQLAREEEAEDLLITKLTIDNAAAAVKVATN